MIGNDIVDLKQAAKDSNWQRPRFLDKVFTKHEQDYINTSQQKHKTVWLLWSMKEAAYKIHVQQFGKRFFNPKKMNCTLTSETTGFVSIDAINYKTESTITENYIYTIATTKDTNNLKSSCFNIETPLYKIQSSTVKAQFLEHFSKVTATPLSSLTLTKNEAGIPKLFKGSIKVNLSLSFTHHGVFCGYGYCF